MNTKQIYLILNTWFPELTHYPMPDRQQRMQFDVLIQWLSSPKQYHRPRRYVMTINQQLAPELDLHHNAVIQDLMFDLAQFQNRIKLASSKIIQHYEKYKQSIGSHCNLSGHIIENFFKELSMILIPVQYQLLLIYGEKQHWLAVPNDVDQIEQFCLLFNKQFRAFGQNIELYQIRQLSWST